MSEEKIKKIMKDLKLNSLDEIYLSIGTLRFTVAYIISLTNETKDKVEDILIEKVSHKYSEVKNYKNDIIVAGIGDIMVSIAKCCKPIKGEDIVGFITKGQGITIHKKNCPNITSKTDRLIEVAWNMQNETTYLTDLYVLVDNDKNYLSDVIATFTKRNLNIESIKINEYPQSSEYEFSFKVKNTEEINKIIIDLENLSYVIKVERNK